VTAKKGLDQRKREGTGTEPEDTYRGKEEREKMGRRGKLSLRRSGWKDQVLGEGEHKRTQILAKEHRKASKS